MLLFISFPVLPDTMSRSIRVDLSDVPFSSRARNLCFTMIYIYLDKFVVNLKNYIFCTMQYQHIRVSPFRLPTILYVSWVRQNLSTCCLLHLFNKIQQLQNCNMTHTLSIHMRSCKSFSLYFSVHACVDYKLAILCFWFFEICFFLLQTHCFSSKHLRGFANICLLSITRTKSFH